MNDIGETMLGSISILECRDKMFVLEVIQGFKCGVVLLPAHEIVGMINGVEYFEGVREGSRSVGNVLSHSFGIDECSFLLGQLLSAALNGLVEFENLGGQRDTAFANVLKPADGIEKLFVFCETNTFDVGFSFLRVSTKTMRQRGCSVRMRGIFQYRYQLIEEIRIRGCMYDLCNSKLAHARRNWKAAGLPAEPQKRNHQTLEHVAALRRDRVETTSNGELLTSKHERYWYLVMRGKVQGK